MATLYQPLFIKYSGWLITVIDSLQGGYVHGNHIRNVTLLLASILLHAISEQLSPWDV